LYDVLLIDYKNKEKQDEEEKGGEEETFAGENPINKRSTHPLEG
jgi:hypothetical protein